MKEHRFSKYLLYASGEIVLVVIGILIALQINTWNEEKQHLKKVRSYTENLIQDLATDSANIQRVLKGIEEEHKTLDAFKERLAASAAPLDSVYHFARYGYNYYIWVPTDFNTDTYEVLNSTGDIGLFDQHIIRGINAMVNEQDRCNGASLHTVNSYIGNLHAYASKYPVPFEYNLFPKGSSAADLIWDGISLRDHATEFNALVLAKGDSYRLSKRYLTELSTRTNALLHDLRALH